MKRRLLVVDDNAIERAMLDNLLKEEYEVTLAESGQEALSQLSKSYKSVSGIVLDLMMPVMDGYEVIKRIRQNLLFQQIPIIVVTALQDDESRERAIICGANGFVNKPFNRTILLYTLRNEIKLRETAAIVNLLRKDKLTGVLTRDAFLEDAAVFIKRAKQGTYVLSCVDINNFKIINDQYGTEKGDEVLRESAKTLLEFAGAGGGIVCRIMADKFVILYHSSVKDSELYKRSHYKFTHPECLGRAVYMRIGRYPVTDLNLSVNSMIDRATLAEESIKGHYGTYVAEYTDSIRENIIKEQRIVNDMNEALAAGEFETWFQPQYNHVTGALIGAEALVRWRKDGKLVPPNDFIPIFERNGFIYDLDKYVWRRVCELIRSWIASGRSPLPVSVNISRFDILQDDFISVIEGLKDEFKIPPELLRLEVTESAFAESTRTIIGRVNELIKLGCTVEIDDFGSGYSSLNTLKDVPAAILKLDMRFFENTGNSQRGGNIVESVVRMAKWLGMAIIAEGVEDKPQADYLKSIGCYYIQGYYYARPMPLEDYERLCESAEKEPRLSRLTTVQTWNNSAFWDAHSMETLVFNSYVGGACIFEYHNNVTEVIRFNESYEQIFSGEFAYNFNSANGDPLNYLSASGKRALFDNINKAIHTKKESSCEVRLESESGKLKYLRVTVRLIAVALERYLFYSVLNDITQQREAEHKQREAEKKELESAKQLQAIMGNINGGVVAIKVYEDGSSRIVFYNEKYFELFGFARETNKENIDIISLIAPEDKERMLDAIVRQRNDGLPRIIDYRTLKVDGTSAYLRVNSSLMNMEGYGEVITAVVTDITEQKELYEQFKAVVDNINGAVTAVVIRNDLPEFLIVNNQFYEMLGYTKEQYERECRSKYDRIHPDDYDRVVKQFRDSASEPKRYTMEYRIIRRDGSVRTIVNRIHVMRMLGVDELVQLSVMNDVTDIRTAEMKEREASDRLNAIMNHISSSISAVTIENGKVNYHFVNERYYELVGYSKEAYRAKFGAGYGPIAPCDRERVMTELEKAVPSGGLVKMDYRVIRGDGKQIWVRERLINTKIAGINGDVLLGIIDDITEQKEAERRIAETSEQLKVVLDKLACGVTAVAVSSANNDFLFANDKYYELIGYSREEYHNLIVSPYSILHPEDRDMVCREINAIIKTNGTIDFKYRIIRPDGETRWLHTVASMCVFPGEDRPIQLAVFEDVTVEQQYSAQLRFLNNAAHDILAQPDTEKAMEDTLHKIIGYFDADRAYVFEYNERDETESNTYEVCKDGISRQISNLQNIPMSFYKSWNDKLFANEIINIENVNGLDGSEAPLREILLKQNIHSVIVAPLWRNGKLIGYAGVDNPSKSARQAQGLTALNDYIAVLLTRRDLTGIIKRDDSAIELLMKDTPGGFCRFEMTSDTAPRITYANEDFCDMLGIAPERAGELIGREGLELVHPDDAAQLRDIFLSRHKESFPFNTRCRLKKADGEYLWTMVFGRFYSAGSDGYNLNAYFTDISSAKETEDMQRRLLDNMPCGAALYEYKDGQINVVHINKRYWQLVERSPYEYNDESVLAAVFQADRGIIAREIDSAIRQKRNAICDVRILVGKSEYKPFHIVANIVRGEGGVYLLYTCYLALSDKVMSLQDMLPIALRTVMSSSDDIAYIKDKDLRYVSFSRAAAIDMGFKNERDIIGKCNSEVFSPRLAEIFTESDTDVMKTGKAVVNILQEIPDAKKGFRYITTSKYPLIDSDGSVVGIYGVSRDVTGARENESQLRLLTESIPGGLASFEFSKNGIRVMYYNEGFYNFSGYTREEYEEITKKDPYALIVDEDKGKIRDVAQMLIKTHGRGDIGECVYRCRTKEGKLRWFSFKGKAADITEDRFVLNCVLYDITAEREAQESLRVSEEENRLAIEHTGSILTRFDIKRRTLSLPKSLNPMYEVSGVLTGMPYEQVALARVSKDTADDYIGMFENIIKGEKAGGCTFQQHSQKGWRWLRAQFTTVFNSSDEPVSAVITFADITDQLEKEFVYNKWQQSLNERDEKSYTLFRCNLSKNASYDSREGSLLTINFSEDKSTFDERTAEYTVKCVAPEDRMRYLAFMNSNALLANYYRGHRSDFIEYKGIDDGGRLRYIRLSVDLVEYPNSKDVEAYLMYEDIDEKKRLQLLTLKRSETDELTGALNRITFIDRFKQIVAGSAGNEIHALIMLDIDGFKQVNDTKGHAAGDLVLRSLAASISSILRKDDLVGRLGGDEFFVFLRSIPRREVAEKKAKQICALNLQSNPEEPPITVSLGIALIPSDGQDFETLYSKVDAALYRQKERGKNGFTFADDK